MAATTPEFGSPHAISDIAHQLRQQGPAGLPSLLARCGPLALRLAALSNALDDRLRQPRLRNYPPSVFLAYKWEDEAHQEAVRQLVEVLRERGYDVLLDQDHLAYDAGSYAEVPQYIAGMVACDLFLMVLSERYVDKVTARSGHTTWVHDEYNAALLQHRRGRLRLHGLLLPGVHAEGALAGVPLTRLGQWPPLPSELDRAFPGYRGKRLDGVEVGRLSAFAQAFDDAMQMEPSDIEGMRRALLEAHAEFGTLADFAMRVGRFCVMVGETERAGAIAHQLMDDVQFDDEALFVAQALDAAGATATALRFLHRQRRLGRLKGSMHDHYFMAETLREQGSTVAAWNQFGWLVRSEGFALQPEMLRTSIAQRHAQLAAEVVAMPSDRLVACDTCAAQYPCSGSRDQVCGDCGTLYERAVGDCPVCGNDGKLPLMLLGAGVGDGKVRILCPVCSEGSMQQRVGSGV